MKINISILLVFLSFVFFKASAQEPKEIRKANKYYNNENYCEALNTRLKLLRRSIQKVEKLLSAKVKWLLKRVNVFEKWRILKEQSNGIKKQFY
jgi:hypothetical protein